MSPFPLKGVGAARHVYPIKAIRHGGRGADQGRLVKELGNSGNRGQATVSALDEMQRKTRHAPLRQTDCPENRGLSPVSCCFLLFRCFVLVHSALVRFHAFRANGLAMSKATAITSCRRPSIPNPIEPVDAWSDISSHIANPSMTRKIKARTSTDRTTGPFLAITAASPNKTNGKSKSTQNINLSLSYETQNHRNP